MDRYDAFYECEHRGHQDQTVDLILNYGFLAPAKISRDERHKQFLRDAALCRLSDWTTGTTGLTSLTESMRQRLGALLIRLGTALQGSSAASRHLANTASAAAPSVG